MEKLQDIIIETPKGSAIKYVWDEKVKKMRLKRVLPSGLHFPFNFGFFPRTFAEDGDPLDVLLLMEIPLAPNTMVNARIIGAMKVEQTKLKTYRNDRIIAVECTCEVYGHYQQISDVSESLKKQLTHFFKAYNSYRGLEFKTIGWADVDEAITLIEAAKLSK